MGVPDSREPSYAQCEERESMRVLMSAYGKLIFDVGMHNGDDAVYYLSRGCRVVALEANEALCHAARLRFAGSVQSGALTIVNAALYETAGSVLKFHISNVNAEFSSLDDWRPAAVGATTTTEVTSVDLPSLIEQYGVPYFAKCDIEGGGQVFRGSVSAT